MDRICIMVLEREWVFMHMRLFQRDNQPLVQYEKDDKTQKLT